MSYIGSKPTCWGREEGGGGERKLKKKKKIPLHDGSMILNPIAIFKFHIWGILFLLIFCVPVELLGILRLC